MEKVISTRKLNELIGKAVMEDYNAKGPSRKVHFDPNGRHVVKQAFMHNDAQARCVVLAKLTGSDKPYEFFLDIELGDYNALPDYKG